MKNRITGLFAIVSLIIVSYSGTVFATPIVVPNSYATVEGNSNNCFPYTCTPRHYQQVYEASEFGSQLGFIDQILYRVDGNGNSFTANFDIEITLSHTTADSSTLSSVFANNLGGDATLVLDSSSYAVSGTDLGGSEPNPFDVIFDVDNLFYYNGTSNLLVDIIVYGGSAGVQFDATSDGSIGRLWNSDTNATSGTTGYNYGLVTAFEFVPVPEPSTLTLMFFGLVGLVFLRRRFTV